MGEIRILVVEDSEDQAGLLRRYLERAGCLVTVVGTAEHAIVAYREQEPHVAVIDLQLPGIDGWELSRLLRAELPGVAIVITSVLDESDFPVSHANLPKPFTGDQVRGAIARALPEWVAA
jgi:CheY-like chemotaxis protein